MRNSKPKTTFDMTREQKFIKNFYDRKHPILFILRKNQGIVMEDVEKIMRLYSKAENAALRQQVKDMGEVIKELNGRIINLQSADMTHEYNQAEAQRVWPQIEQQIRDDEREKTLAQFGITTGP